MHRFSSLLGSWERYGTLFIISTKIDWKIESYLKYYMKYNNAMSWRKVYVKVFSPIPRNIKMAKLLHSSMHLFEYGSFINNSVMWYSRCSSYLPHNHNRSEKCQYKVLFSVSEGIIKLINGFDILLQKRVRFLRFLRLLTSLG